MTPDLDRGNKRARRNTLLVFTPSNRGCTPETCLAGPHLSVRTPTSRRRSAHPPIFGGANSSFRTYADKLYLAGGYPIPVAPRVHVRSRKVKSQL